MGGAHRHNELQLVFVNMSWGYEKSREVSHLSAVITAIVSSLDEVKPAWLLTM